MNDREKVTLGLWHHAGNKPPIPCDGCPYDDGDPHCSQRLAEDAFALLKEQEPRVLGFRDLDETTTYWMEDNHEANRKTTCIPETIMDIIGDRVFTIPIVKLINGYAPVISKNREGYGKTWRAWTSRPTPDQMRDTKWEGDSDAEIP